MAQIHRRSNRPRSAGAKVIFNGGIGDRRTQSIEVRDSRLPVPYSELPSEHTDGRYGRRGQEKHFYVEQLPDGTFEQTKRLSDNEVRAMIAAGHELWHGTLKNGAPKGRKVVIE